MKTQAVKQDSMSCDNTEGVSQESHLIQDECRPWFYKAYVGKTGSYKVMLTLRNGMIMNSFKKGAAFQL